MTPTVRWFARIVGFSAVLADAWVWQQILGWLGHDLDFERVLLYVTLYAAMGVAVSLVAHVKYGESAR